MFVLFRYWPQIFKPPAKQQIHSHGSSVLVGRPQGGLCELKRAPASPYSDWGEFCCTLPRNPVSQGRRHRLSPESLGLDPPLPLLVLQSVDTFLRGVPLQAGVDLGSQTLLKKPRLTVLGTGLISEQISTSVLITTFKNLRLLTLTLDGGPRRRGHSRVRYQGLSGMFFKHYWGRLRS